MSPTGAFLLSSTVCSYADTELYAKALPQNSIDLHVTGRGEFKARTATIALHETRIHRFSDNLPRIAHAGLPPGRTIIVFRTEPGPDLFWSGLQMLPTRIVRLNDGSSSFQRSAGSASWGSISLPPELMDDCLAVLAGRCLASPRDPVSLGPPPDAMARLQRLHAACDTLAERAPELLANPEAVRGIEQALLEATADCLGSADERNESKSQHFHAKIMQRFRDVVEANADRALYMAEISVAIGVSARTLRNCCSEHLGMSAGKYLALRRMHLANRALRRNRSEITTVTEVATNYGFWELGRFSVSYKALFGEMPSQTLRRERGVPAKGVGLGLLRGQPLHLMSHSI
jgi:AraC-like DNA-binding protein